MKIAKVWKADFPWDIRVEKIINSLKEEGHDVHLICSNIEKNKIRDEINGIQIHRLPWLKIDIFNKIFNLPFFLNPVWIYKIFQVIKSEKIEIILVRDLPLVLSAIMVGKFFGIPVIFDVAENYPAMWREIVDKDWMHLYNYFLKNPMIANTIEAFALKKVSHIIVVVEESKKRIMEKGIPENKVSIVSNTPNMKDINGRLNKISLLNDKFKLLYTGFIDKGRGLDIVMNSLSKLKERIDNICVLIVGKGEHLAELRRLARELGVEEYLITPGWVDKDIIHSYIRDSDICLIPHYAIEEVTTTIPNKLFDYMACKKPVIVSDAAPLKRIVEETRSGLVFRSGDVNDFIDKVLCLKDSCLRSEMGENGYRAIINKYNWENDSQILKRVFNAFKQN